MDLVHNVISGALNYALRMEVVWRNPVQAVTPPKVVRQEVEPPDIGEVQQILDIAQAEEHPLFACVHLLAYSGIRRGDALGLRWQDVDLDAGSISIVQALVRSLYRGLIFEPPKSNSGRRTIDIDAGTTAVLRAHQGTQLLHKWQLGEAYQDYNLVFPDHIGEPLNPMAVTRTFQSLAKKAGLSGIKLHDLRHFHASVMLQQGQSPALVSKRLVMPV